MKESVLRYNPKSKVLKHGYINIYSELNPKELRATEYKTQYKVDNDDWDETLVYLSKKFRDLGLKDTRVLDAGCGHGNFIIDENRQSIAWASGIDISEEFVSKNVCLDEIKISNLENIPYEPNTFDVCISLWVLEHVHPPPIIFEEVYRVLKPNGYFLFATPNKNFLPLRIISLFRSKRLNQFINKYIFDRKPQDIFETHYKANSLQDLQALSEGDFEIIELFYNYDPSYLALNDYFYTTGNFLNKLFRNMKLRWFDSHIIGVLRKK